MREWKVLIIGTLGTCFAVVAACGPREWEDGGELGDTTGSWSLAGTQSTSFQDGVLPSTHRAGGLAAGRRDGGIHRVAQRAGAGGGAAVGGHAPQ